MPQAKQPHASHPPKPSILAATQPPPSLKPSSLKPNSLAASQPPSLKPRSLKPTPEPQAAGLAAPKPKGIAGPSPSASQPRSLAPPSDRPLHKPSSLAATQPRSLAAPQPQSSQVLKPRSTRTTSPAVSTRAKGGRIPQVHSERRIPPSLLFRERRIPQLYFVEKGAFQSHSYPTRSRISRPSTMPSPSPAIRTVRPTSSSKSSTRRGDTHALLASSAARWVRSGAMARHDKTM